ncbi:MAG: hypothetical protein D6813_09365 [Calditrichaeota bacterium]|nr:MAG: hypothetical protein D6813_09365 [Calditrichota bacterium]
MFELPFKISTLIYFSLVALFIGLVLLAIFVINRVLKRKQQPVKRVSLTQSIFRLFLIIVWISLSLAALFLFAFIQSYQSFTKKELVAVVQCVPLPEKQKTMRMELVLMENGHPYRRKTFILYGDQWTIEGHILKWDDWLNFLGLHTMYKLTRVRGRYLTTREERINTPSVYSLVTKEEDPRWRWLYKYGHRLPFVQAVYGNTVFTYPDQNKIYEIYVTTSGFMVQVREE